MRREVKERARKLLAEQNKKGLVWSGSFKDLCRSIQKADWELAMDVMGTVAAARLLYATRTKPNCSLGG
jgi:ADP-heptose:LPS heptosyltransferase